MKILYISPNGHLGGAEKAVEHLLRHHDRTHFEPSVAFLRDGPLVKQFRNLDVRTYLLQPVKMRQIWKHGSLLTDIARIAQMEKTDLIHSTMSYGHFFGGRAANQHGIKNVWFQHGPVGAFDKWASLIPTSCILTNSKFMANEQKKIMWRRFSLEVVGAGIELPDMTALDRSTARRNFCRHLGIPEGKLIVGNVGRLQAWKGQLEFLQAFALALRENRNLHAVIVGSSDIGSREYEAELRRVIVSGGLAGSVALTGFVPNIQDAYASFDIFVHSSIAAEPFGLTYLEAMSFEIPALVSDKGGSAENVVDKRDALLIDASKPEEMAQAILMLAMSPQKRSEIGKAGRLKAETFSARSFVSRVERVYRLLG